MIGSVAAAAAGHDAEPQPTYSDSIAVRAAAVNSATCSAGDSSCTPSSGAA